jgi:hypothetical protein
VHFIVDDGHALLEIEGAYVDTLGLLREDNDASGRIFGGGTTLLFDTKSTVRRGDECWILYSFDWPVILRRVESHFAIVADVVIWEEMQVNGGRSLVQSEVSYGSLVNDSTAWVGIKIM